LRARLPEVDTEVCQAFAYKNGPRARDAEPYDGETMFRILVIDDNEDMRDLMRVILEGAGYAVEVAPDGEAGLRLQRERAADAVITDIFMPNRDGLETIARLREEHPQVKVVAMSGGGARVKGDGYLSTAREIGAHVVLAKPFDQDELLRVVRDILH
jgi:CheY-like chemotaxis protein